MEAILLGAMLVCGSGNTLGQLYCKRNFLECTKTHTTTQCIDKHFSRPTLDKTFKQYDKLRKRRAN